MGRVSGGEDHIAQSFAIVIVEFFIEAKRLFRHRFILRIVILVQILMSQSFVNCYTPKINVKFS